MMTEGTDSAPQLSRGVSHSQGPLSFYRNSRGKGGVAQVAKLLKEITLRRKRFPPIPSPTPRFHRYNLFRASCLRLREKRANDNLLNNDGKQGVLGASRLVPCCLIAPHAQQHKRLFHRVLPAPPPPCGSSISTPRTKLTTRSQASVFCPKLARAAPA